MSVFQPIIHVTSPELVTRKIHQASASMFVREFTQNAIEASRFAKNPRVKWWHFEDAECCRKLMIWNNGRGLDADELLEIMNLGASGKEKTQGASENFGLGAKLTGLKGNHAGLLWRSCKHGKVSQLILGWRDNSPGIIPQSIDDDNEELVVDVSDRYQSMTLGTFDKALADKEGADVSMLSFDWTMVVFLGNDLEEQDTCTDPLGDGDPVGGASYWMPKQINRRYYDIAKFSISAICDRGEWEPQSRSCFGLYHLEAEREETVHFSLGQIRYCLLPEQQDSNEQAKGYRGHAALVYKNEVYDGLFDGNWGLSAPKFGIYAGHQRVAIQVVLDSTLEATPNEQRTAIEQELPYGDRRALHIADFIDDIEACLPQFMQEFIALEDAKRTRSSEKINKRIRRLMQDMGLRAYKQRDGESEQIGPESPEGDVPSQPENQPSEDGSPRSGLGEPRKPRTATADKLPRKKSPGSVFGRGGKPMATAAMRTLCDEPEFVWEPAKGENKAMLALFDDKHNKVYLAEDHPVLDAVVEAVLQMNIPEVMRPQIRDEAKDQIGYAAIRHILYAKSMLKSRAFSADDFKHATTPQSLTASIGYFEMHKTGVEYVFRAKKK